MLTSIIQSTEAQSTEANDRRGGSRMSKARIAPNGDGLAGRPVSAQARKRLSAEGDAYDRQLRGPMLKLSRLYSSNLRSIGIGISLAGILIAGAALPVVGINAAGAVSGGPARDPFLQPFSSESIWNTPLGRGAIFQDSSAPETAMFRSDNVGGPSGSFSWISGDGLRIFRQKAGDPLARWFYDGRSATAPWPNEGAVQNSHSCCARRSTWNFSAPTATQ
jgi:hypothetical protein